MQLRDKITTPEQLIECLQQEVGQRYTLNWFHLKEMLNLFGPLDGETFWKWREFARLCWLRQRPFWATRFVYDRPVDYAKQGQFAYVLCYGYDADGRKPMLDLMCDEHFVYISDEDASMVSYTPSAEYGKRDRQVRTKPGRYLTEFFGKANTKTEFKLLDGDEVRQSAACHQNTYNPQLSLHFAKTEQEIVHVYKTGPQSCMSGTGFDKHPTSLYAGAQPPLMVAYLMNGDAITARTLVREDEMKYIRIYGDEAAMQTALASAGYGDSGTLRGVRLPKVKHQGSYIMPYLDWGGMGISDAGDMWLVTREGDGEYSASSTGGYLDTDSGRERCDGCDEMFEEGNVGFYDCVEQSLCESCRDDTLVRALDSRGRGTWCPTEDALCTEDGTYFVDDDAATNNGYRMTDSDEWHPEGDVHYIESEDVYVMRDEAVQVVDKHGNEEYIRYDDVESNGLHEYVLVHNIAEVTHVENRDTDEMCTLVSLLVARLKLWLMCGGVMHISMRIDTKSALRSIMMHDWAQLVYNEATRGSIGVAEFDEAAKQLCREEIAEQEAKQLELEMETMDITDVAA